MNKYKIGWKEIKQKAKFIKTIKEWNKKFNK